MMIPHPTLIINQHRSIPDTAHTRLTPFIETHMTPDSTLLTRVPELRNLRAVDEQRLRSEAVEEGMGVDGGGEGGPEGEGWDVGFGEDDEVGAV